MTEDPFEEKKLRAWIPVAVAIVILTLLVCAHAAPFVLFPKASQLASPDGRFLVRNQERSGSEKEFIGTSHSLWLIESASGRSRKLCDYLGVAAVAWSNNDFLVVTEYVAKKTSRAWIFSANGQRDPVLLDKVTLTRMVPPELRPVLRENDHVFVEASRAENETVQLRAWGYGLHDPRGFRWSCTYSMREGSIFCR